jgi:hypothetical protein
VAKTLDYGPLREEKLANGSPSQAPFRDMYLFAAHFNDILA